MTDSMWAAMFAAQIAVDSGYFLGLARGFLREGGAAEDVCQQAFLKAWTHRHDLQNPAAFKGWMSKIVVTESLLAHRHRQQERAAMAAFSADERLGPRSEEASAPENLIETADCRDAMLLALGELPEPQRTIVVLRHMEGYSGNETRKIIGCSAGEVSKQLNRGLKKLRKVLAAWQADYRE
jgi:RNA polymerase sigma-70 factor (ECF subfamily)